MRAPSDIDVCVCARAHARACVRAHVAEWYFECVMFVLSQFVGFDI